jgi:phosphoglycolate phosphatase
LAHAADQLPEGPVIFVGDSDVDAATAEAAGVPFLLHTAGYCGPPHASLRQAGAFADFAELPGLVARLVGADALA